MIEFAGGWGVIITVAAVLTALAAIWKVVLPIIRIIARLDEAVPKLFVVAERFDSLEAKVDRLHEYAHNWRHDMANTVVKLALRLHLLERRVHDLDGIQAPTDEEMP